MATDVPKLRRFALGVGLILIVYTLAWVQLAKLINISPFGISFEIARPSVIEWGLVIVSIYAALRYWYYSFIKNTSPFRARTLLLKHEYPYETFSEPSQAREIISRFFPRLAQEAFKIDPIGDKGSGTCVVNVDSAKIPWRVRFWTGLENLDYSAPIWVNGMAIMMFFVSRASNG